MEQNKAKDTDMDLLTIPEACKWLRIGTWNIYQHINSGALKSVKIGKNRYIRKGTMYEFIISREH